MNVQIKPKQSNLTVKLDRNDHESLTKRNNPNQHTIEAITGLSEALLNLNTLIVDLQGKVNLNDENSTIALEEVTKKLTELINETVNNERDRALNAEQEIRDSFNSKLEDIAISTDERFDNTEEKIENLNENTASLKAELIELGNEVSMRVNIHQKDKKELLDYITTETERATAEELDLKANLKEECIRAQKQEEILSNLIHEETERAEGVELNLLGLVNFETNRAKEEEKRLQDKINEERSDALKREAVISEKLNTEISRSIAEDEKLAEDIHNESDRAKNKEALLDTRITNEQTRAEIVESQLDNKIKEETIRAEAAEAVLRNNLEFEIIRAENAEKVLQKAIDDETSTRIEEDNLIREYIDKHIAEVDLRTDVVDIVATKAKLDSYDKLLITENDVIKVLADESSFGATTYYRLVGNTFLLVGKIGPYYTKSEINAQTRHLRDNNIDFNGTKTFTHIKSNQTPELSEDLTNKRYVDDLVTSEMNRASLVETSLQDQLNAEINRSVAAENNLSENLVEVTRNLVEVTRKIDSKADLVEGKVPASQLPEFKTTNIFEFKSFDDFPETGLEGNLYISTDDDVIYRWNGQEYKALSSAGFKEDTSIIIRCEI